MKTFLAAIVFIISATGLASSKQPITLDMKLSIDGRLVSHPTVVSMSGETVSVESASEDGSGVYIEVTPTLQNKNEVFMKFVVSKLEEGKKTIISKSTIMSFLGKTGEISQESTTGESNESMSLVVTCRNQDLI